MKNNKSNWSFIIILLITLFFLCSFISELDINWDNVKIILMHIDGLEKIKKEIKNTNFKIAKIKYLKLKEK